MSEAEQYNNSVVCVCSNRDQELYLLSLCHDSSYDRHSPDFLLPLLPRLPHFVTAAAAAAAVQQMTNQALQQKALQVTVQLPGHVTGRANALEPAEMAPRKLVEQLAGKVSEQVTMKTVPEQVPEQLPEQSPELMTRKAAESAAAAAAADDEAVPGRVTGAAAVMVIQTVAVTEADADFGTMTEAERVRMTAAVSGCEADVGLPVTDDVPVMVVTMTVTDAQRAEIGGVTDLDCANKGGLTGVAAWEGCASVVMTPGVAD